MATHIRIDSPMFGVAISYFWHFGALKDSATLRRHRGVVFICGLLFLSPAFLFEVETTPWLRIAGFILIYVGARMMLVGALFFDVTRTGLVNVIATLGSYSYSIYLWHLAIVFWGVQILLKVFGQDVTWYLYFTSYILGSLLLGVIAAKLIEMPALALRNRWFPSNSRGSIS